MKRKVYITLHGYKRHDWDEFSSLRESIDLDAEAVIFDYYDITKKELINENIWYQNIIDKINEYQDYDVTLIAYSIGGVAGLAAASELPQVKRVFAIAPAVKTRILIWIYKGLFVLPARLIMKPFRKMYLSKEEYQKTKTKVSRGSNDPYPFKTVFTVQRFKASLKKLIKYIENKDIEIVYARQDGIVSVSRSKRYIRKHMSDTNTLDIKYVDIPHEELLDIGSPVYKELDKFIKK